MLARYNLKSLGGLYAGIGSGDICLNHLVNFLQSKLIKVSAEQVDQEILRHVATKSVVNSHRPLLPVDSGRCHCGLYHNGAWHFHSPQRLRTVFRCAGGASRAGGGIPLGRKLRQGFPSSHSRCRQ